MFLCILNNAGNILMHKNMPAKPEAFVKAIAPYKEDIVIGVECMFSWYWLADLCIQQGIQFILGHALYMRCIHGGKAKSDKIDSEKIARLMKGGNFPLAYTYPQELRPVRDLLRRRHTLVRQRAELLAHVRLTHHQYNKESPESNISRPKSRETILERFNNPSVRKNVEVDLSVADHITAEVKQLENYIIKHARSFDSRTFFRLKTVPGVGDILALTILYEIGDIDRFPKVQAFCSYARLIKCQKESAGKIYGHSGQKIGNPYLKWAFSEAAALFMRESQRAKNFVNKLETKHGKGKAMSILSHRLGRAVYFVIKRKDSFDEKYFFK